MNTEQSTKEPNHDQLGQSMVLFALMLPIIFAMAGLVIDLGYGFAQKRFAQNAADAAAIRAAQQIALQNYDVATSSATTEAIKNLVVTNYTINVVYTDTQAATSNNGWYAIPKPSTSTTWASVSQTHRTFFMGVLGIGTMSESASAKAALYATQPVSNTFGLNTLPFCISDKYMQTVAVKTNTCCDNQKNLWYPNGLFPFWDSGNDKDRLQLKESPSDSGICDLDQVPNENPSTVTSWIMPGYTGTLTIGMQIPMDNGNLGNNVSSLATALQQYINTKGTDIGDGKGKFATFYAPMYNASPVSKTTPGPCYGTSYDCVVIYRFVWVKVYLKDVQTSTAYGTVIDSPPNSTIVPGPRNPYDSTIVKLIN